MKLLHIRINICWQFCESYYLIFYCIYFRRKYQKYKKTFSKTPSHLQKDDDIDSESEQNETSAGNGQNQTKHLRRGAIGELIDMNRKFSSLSSK